MIENSQYIRKKNVSLEKLSLDFLTIVYSHRLGYPFPTAPPVDPFAKIKVDDCGKTKGCFRLVDLRVGYL